MDASPPTIGAIKLNPDGTADALTDSLDGGLAVGGAADATSVDTMVVGVGADNSSDEGGLAAGLLTVGMTSSGETARSSGDMSDQAGATAMIVGDAAATQLTGFDSPATANSGGSFAGDVAAGAASAGSNPMTGAGDPGPQSGVATHDVVTFATSNLTFNNTFESSVSAAFKANILTAEQTIASLWTDKVTLNFDFKAAALGTNSFLANNSFFLDNVTYAQLRGALQAKSGDSAIALKAFNSLPTTDPQGGVTYSLPDGYAGFLGLGSGTTTDTTTLNTSFNWSFGQDVVNAMIHEISEGGMGRVGGLGVGLGGRFSTMDLFSYSAQGQRDLSTTDTARAFSFDGGMTTSSPGLTYFAANSGNDSADFQQLDVFGTGNPGETNTISQTDINTMDALGWTPPCYCRGTRILTDRGEVAVEELAVGDQVQTLSGGLKPIRWIGMGRDLVTRANKLARPVIVRRGALADNVPNRDLYVTHGHGLYLGGVLIPVENLINHRSILWDECAGVVEYYHIELADHDVVLANGAPAETYYDASNRAQFHNTRPESTPGAAAPTFAPVLTGGAAVDRIWMALFERAGGRIEADATDDPDLHLIVNSERLDPAAVDGFAYTFALDAAPATGLRLCSRSGVPSLLGITAHDHRRLGVAISRLTISQSGIATALDSDASLLVEGGCHAAENGYCWTDGELALPACMFAHLTGPFTVTVHVERPGMRYPVAAPLTQAA